MFLCNLLRNLFHNKILYCCWFLLVNTKTGSVEKGKVLCPTNCGGKIEKHNQKMSNAIPQGVISCGILVSGIGARGLSSEHMENMEMFSCSPT